MSKDEAERLAEDYFGEDGPGYLGMRVFMDAFRAGEKSERVMRLVSALEFYSRQGEFHPYDSNISVIDDYGQRAKEALAAFNASQEGGE